MSEPIITNIFPKKPRETRWFPISFKAQLEANGDTPRESSPIELGAVPAGISIVSQVFTPGTAVFQMLISGGTDKKDYPLTMWIHTTRGQRLQHDIVISVREKTAS